MYPRFIFVYDQQVYLLDFFYFLFFSDKILGDKMEIPMCEKEDCEGIVKPGANFCHKFVD